MRAVFFIINGSRRNPDLISDMRLSFQQGILQVHSVTLPDL